MYTGTGGLAPHTEDLRTAQAQSSCKHMYTGTGGLVPHTEGLHTVQAQSSCKHMLH